MRISDWSSDVCSSDLNAAVDIVTEFHWADPFSSCEQCSLPPPPLSSRPALARVMVEIVGPTSARISSGGISKWAASNHARSVARFSCRRSEEHTSELQSLMRISYAVFCLKKKKNKTK